jgi:hypothetical protein
MIFGDDTADKMPDGHMILIPGDRDEVADHFMKIRLNPAMLRDHDLGVMSWERILFRLEKLLMQFFSFSQS